MSAEERWAQQREWEQERGEVEIKWRSENLGPSAYLCDWPTCEGASVRTYEVGRVQDHGGQRFDVCAEHDSDDCARELYRRSIDSE